MGKSKKFKSLSIPTNQDGFVLITALMVIFLIVSIVTTVALVTAQDLRAAARARAIITTRLMAESVSDAVFASIAQETNGYENAAKRNFSNNSSAAPSPTNNPLFASPTNYGGWFILEASGTLRPCSTRDDLKETCFRAIIETTSGPFAIETVELNVVARGGCIVRDDLSLRNCVYRKFTQVFQTRSFVDTAQITNSELPSPDIPGYSNIYVRPPAEGGAPFPVAYLPTDNIDGDVLSNDDRSISGLFYCGNTQNILVDGQFRTSKNQLSPEALDAGDCEDTLTSFVIGERGIPSRFLPTQIDRTGRNDVGDAITSNSVFKDLAGGAALSPYNLTSGARIILGYGNLTINGNVYAYPSNGVIYVEGDIAELSGKFSRPLSIVASGNITITDNILYAPDPINTLDGSSEISSDDLLGILSAKNIILTCSGANCLKRNIVATLSAPFGTVYNDGWASVENLSTDYANPPRITVYGAIIADSRPVFGSFFATDDNPSSPPGAIKYGWAKTITLNKRLLLVQPPYFFRTSQASVVRTGLETSACEETFCT